MADYRGISSVSTSLKSHIESCLANHEPQNAKAHLVMPEELTDDYISKLTKPALLIFLYRVDINKTMRAAWINSVANNGVPSLPLELHYLLIPIAKNAETQQMLLGRTIQCLHEGASLSSPLLDSFSNWSLGESIQILMEEISTGDLMGLFDTLPIDYRLCAPFTLRVLRLDIMRDEQAKPVALVDVGVRSGADI